MRLERRTDLEALVRGHTVVYRDHEARCEVCSAVIAPAAMLQRVEALLSGGDSDGSASATFMRRCPSCRLPGMHGPGV